MTQPSSPMANPAKLGILSLDTAFPRIPGDVGSPDSYPFPTDIEIVDGADSPLIVKDGTLDEDLLQRFEASAKALEARGCSAIVSTCGFLITAQTRIAATVKAPVLLSALSLAPLVRTACPGKLGILTASARSLGFEALTAAGLTSDEVSIAGLEHIEEFTRTFLTTRSRQPATFDSDAVSDAVINAGLELRDRNPDLSAIILECGNLPPYAKRLRAELNLPVFNLRDAAISLLSAA